MVDESAVVGPRSGLGFEEFFESAFPWLSRLAFLLTGSSSVADEIAQDACEQVLRRWDDVTHPRAYARLAVVNGARGWGRRQSRRRLLPIDRVDEHVMVDADAIGVRTALASLPLRVRQVIVLRFYADMRVDDIAEALDMPAGTVKSDLHRGLARLQEELS